MARRQYTREGAQAHEREAERFSLARCDVARDAQDSALDPKMNRFPIPSVQSRRSYALGAAAAGRPHLVNLENESKHGPCT